MGLFQTFGRFLSKNSPVILTTAGVVGVFATAVLTGKATLEAQMMIDAAEKEAWNRDTSFNGFTFRGKVEITWQRYIPAALMGLSTAACIIGAHSINVRRQAALLSLYSLTEATLKEYKDKVLETIGENKERQIRESIDQDRIDRKPVSESTIYLANGGEVLCYDSMSGRYFESDMETLRRAQNDINAKIIDEMYASLNEFYGLIGLGTTVLGEEVGWNTERFLEIEFGATLSDNNRPCMVLNYRVLPTNNYSELH